MSLTYRELWLAGGYDKDNRLDNSLNYVRAHARKIYSPNQIHFLIKRYPQLKDLAEIIVGATTLADEVAELAIGSVFADVESGVQFSLTECPCGCGIDKSGTAITHEMIKRVNAMSDEVNKDQLEAFETYTSKAIRSHTNEEIQIRSDAIEGILEAPEAPGWLRRFWRFLNKPLWVKDEEIS